MEKNTPLEKHVKVETPDYINCPLIEDKIRLQIETMRKLIEEKMPTNGSWFKDFAEDFSTKNCDVYARAAAMAVERNEHDSNRAYLSYNLLHPAVFLNASTSLCYGDKYKLLEFLSKEETHKEIVSVFYMLEDKLKNIEE